MVVSQNYVNFHDHTPNKGRTIATERAFQPTNMYRKHVYKAEDGATKLDYVQESWIGKFFIPEGYQPRNPNVDNYVMEREIAKHTRPWVYMVHYAGAPGAGKYMARSTGIDIVTKPDAQYHPSRVNLILESDNKIKSIEFF